MSKSLAEKMLSVSHHPLAHKLAVARTLHNRANAHCTYFIDGLKERKRVSQALMMNGYQRRVSQGGRNLTRNQSREENDPRATVTIP